MLSVLNWLLPGFLLVDYSVYLFCCCSYQLDFQLPALFELEYTTKVEGNLETPVMIHRTVLGSIERMLSILLDHYQRKWPFWLSPRQVIVCSSSNNENHCSYAEQVLQSWLHSLWALAVTWRVLSLPIVSFFLSAIIQTGEEPNSWSWLQCWRWHNRQKHLGEGSYYKLPDYKVPSLSTYKWWLLELYIQKDLADFFSIKYLCFFVRK